MNAARIRRRLYLSALVIVISLSNLIFLIKPSGNVRAVEVISYITLGAGIGMLLAFTRINFALRNQ
jgi:hypothetical protein